MKYLKFTKTIPFAALVAILGLASQGFAAAAKRPNLPDTLTAQGKTYRSVEFVSAAPDGLVIEYEPQAGGLGLTKLKFRHLPQNIRQQFNYSEQAAADFEAAREEALAQWRERVRNAQEEQEQQAAQEQQEEQAPPSGIQFQPPFAGDEFPIGRFQAAGTIRGAMIVDTVTGEAWLADLHSTLGHWEDYGYFLQPKLLLPVRTQEGPSVVIIGP